MQQWYLIQTKPRRESLAEKNLQQQGFMTYLPWLLTRKRLRERWREVIEPLFPRYLFIQLDLDTDNSAPIRSTFGVSRMVRFGDTPATVPDVVITSLQQREQEGIIRLTDQTRFKKGDKLRIAEGPMKELEAIFQCQRGEDRAIVLITVLGELRQVNIDINHLVL